MNRLGVINEEDGMCVLEFPTKDYHIPAELLEGLLEDWAELIVMKDTTGC
jgi:hypothetical protein